MFLTGSVVQIIYRECIVFQEPGLVVEHQTRDRKVESLNPGTGHGRIFFSRFNCLCRLLSGVRSIPVLPQWHVKDPSHSAKSANSSKIGSEEWTILGHPQLIECMGICVLSLAHVSELRDSDIYLHIEKKKWYGHFSLNSATVCALGWPLHRIF